MVNRWGDTQYGLLLIGIFVESNSQQAPRIPNQLLFPCHFPNVDTIFYVLNNVRPI